MSIFNTSIKRPTINPETDLSLDLIEGTTAEEIIEDVNLENIFQSLLSQANTEYNNLTDTVIPVSNGRLTNPDQVRALRNENRFRALEQRERINRLRNAYIQRIEQDMFFVGYDSVEEAELAILLTGSPGYSGEGKISSRDYVWLKEQQSARALQNETRGLVGEITGVIDESFYDFGGIIRDEDNLTNDYYDLNIITRGIDIFDDRINDFPDSQAANSSRGFVTGWDSVMDAQRNNQIAIATLGQVDRDNSYIDTLFGRNTVDIELMDRPEKFTIEEILENCFDCFLNAWNGEIDFALGLDIELNLRAFMDALDFLLDKIALALDLGAMIRANLCSLLRIGILCPIELAFLIASFIGLLRFFITEVILDFKGFLFEILAALINPLLSALQVISRLAIAPFNIYAGCVMETILTAQQIDETVSQFRFTTQQIRSILNRDNEEITARLNRMSRRSIESLTGGPVETSEDLTGEERVRRWLQENLNPREINRLIFASVPQQITGREALEFLGSFEPLDFLSNPALLNARDPLDLIGTLLGNHSEKLGDTYRWILAALDALKEFVRSNSVSRMELSAKIIVLSELISLLAVVYRLIVKDIEVCRVEEDENGDSRIVTTIDPMELLSSPEIAGNYVYAQPGENIVDGNVIPDPDSPGYIYNPETGNRFEVIRCQRGKGEERIVSRDDMISLLQNI